MVRSPAHVRGHHARVALPPRHRDEEPGHARAPSRPSSSTRSTRWPATSGAATSASRSNGSPTCAPSRRRGWACRPRRSRSSWSPRSWSAPAPARTAGPTARSSTPGTGGRSTSRSSSPTASSRRWPPPPRWATCSTGSPSTSPATAPPSCSSTPAGWPSGWPTSWASGSATTWSPPTTGASRRTAGCGSRRRLRAGELKALVATASLELGIDIGPVELVCQIGSPRSIATFLQRVGRSNHTRTGTPRGRLYPLTRDELVECTGLLAAVRAGRLDALEAPVAPLDILAQQIIAETAAEEWKVDDLYALVTTAHPYRSLTRAAFDEVLDLVSNGIETGRGTRAAYVHHDRVNGELRGRKGARLAALTSGGAIPELGDFRVIAEPDETLIGSVNEDWATESMAGDVFILGTHHWQIRQVTGGEVRVVDAGDKHPTIPFWRGEAPARTVELSEEVARIRSVVERGVRGRRPGPGGRRDRRARRRRARRGRHHRHLPGRGPGRARRHAHAGRPRHRAVLRRVRRDAARGPLALRRPAQPGDGLRAAQEVLRRVQLRAPGQRQRRRHRHLPRARTTASRWPTCPASSPRARSGPRCSRPSSISRSSRAAGGGTSTGAWSCCASAAASEVPPHFQRMQSDDLLAACSPAPPPARRTSPGPIEVPDHPLPRQAVHDCLTEALDCDGPHRAVAEGGGGRGALPLRRLHRAVAARPRDPHRPALRVPRRRRGRRPAHQRRLAPPRPPHDDPGDRAGHPGGDRPGPGRDRAGPHHPRRAPRPPQHAAAEPVPAGVGRAPRGPRSSRGRVASLVGDDGSRRWHTVEAARPCAPLVEGVDVEGTTAEQAAAQVLRGHLEVASPLTHADLAARTGLPSGRVTIGLAVLEAEGFAIQGRFSERAVDAGTTRPRSSGRAAACSPASTRTPAPSGAGASSRSAPSSSCASWCSGSTSPAPRSTAASTGWPG